jgi:two-component system, OmpR family, phosphate regulon sensor histidine kinase PhoR
MVRARRRPNPVKSRSRSIAVKVTAVFVAVGTLWIVATDVLLYRFVEDPVLIGRIETAKGWLFIAMAAAFLYWIVDRAVRRLARSDATLHAVVDSIRDGVLVVGPDRAIASANPAAARMLGEDRADRLVGIGPEEFTRRYNLMYPDGHLVRSDELISQQALAGHEEGPYKVIMSPPGRPEVVTICTAAGVRPMPGGPVELAVSVMHDVTALEQLHRAREQFVSAAAHALRTPVTVIKAYVQLLLDAGLPEKTARVIDRQCGKIVRLTDNLIVLARIRTDSLKLKPERISCGELVEEVSREMDDASADHQLVSRVDACPIIFADRERIALAIRNLIDLAYRRSRPRTSVTLALGEIDGRARISVTYEPLVEGELTDGAGFTGLGLENHVTESLAAASRGRMGSERDDRPVRTDWLEFPTMIEGAHA